jgi:glycosyltransferase involved in cell wall biosynthesis
MRQIAERLAQRGLEVFVATGTHPRRAAVEVLNDVQVVSFPIGGNRALGMTGPVSEYQAFLKNGGFDAILIKAAQQWTFDAAVDVLDALPGRKVFIPCGFSGLRDPRYADYFRQMPQWLRRFDDLVFYSDTYQDIEFARAHRLRNLRLIPNGVDEREFADTGCGDIRAELGIPEGDDLLLSVGSMIMAKGHWETLRAFRGARLDRPATLVINGNHPHGGVLPSLTRTAKHVLSGRWPIDWEAALASRRPGKRVLITDLPRDRLIRLYNASNLFVFASHVEYSPLVLFEASASATPFIASDAGNSAEIAAWTRAGIVIKRRDGKRRACEVADLRDAIETMLGKPDLASWGSRGRAAVMSEGFTWARIVDQYIEVLGLS